MRRSGRPPACSWRRAATTSSPRPRPPRPRARRGRAPRPARRSPGRPARRRRRLRGLRRADPSPAGAGGAHGLCRRAEGSRAGHALRRARVRAEGAPSPDRLRAVLASGLTPSARARGTPPATLGSVPPPARNRALRAAAGGIDAAAVAAEARELGVLGWVRPTGAVPAEGAPDALRAFMAFLGDAVP